MNECDTIKKKTSKEQIAELKDEIRRLKTYAFNMTPVSFKEFKSEDFRNSPKSCFFLKEICATLNVRPSVLLNALKGLNLVNDLGLPNRIKFNLGKFQDCLKYNPGTRSSKPVCIHVTKAGYKWIIDNFERIKAEDETLLYE